MNYRAKINNNFSVEKVDTIRLRLKEICYYFVVFFLV